MPKPVQSPVTRAAARIRELEVDHPTAIRSLLNEIVLDLGFPAPWDAPALDLPVVDTIAQVGDVHQLLLGGQHELRGEQGSYYTPDPLAEFLASFTDELERTRLAGVHPTDIAVIDPACGAGVLLVRKARRLTDYFIDVERERITELAPPTVSRAALRRGLFAPLARDCVFGVDIDPVAVDMTKTALWLETDGTVPITWMDDNVIVGDPLNGDLPPRLVDRHGGNPPAFQPHTIALPMDLGTRG